MKTFIEWLEDKHLNEAGAFTNFFRKLNGESLPPNLTPEQIASYEQLRKTGVDHKSALKTVVGTPMIYRPVNDKSLDMQNDIEARWGSR